MRTALAFAYAAFVGLALPLVGAAPELSPLEPGATQTFPWEQLEHPLILNTPADFNAERAQHWPVIFWFHGTNGRPTVDLVRKHTKQQHFFLVGMTYRQPGLLTYTEETVASELENFRGVRDHLLEQLPIDPKRIYIGGFSKGGWTAALFTELIGEELAGTLCLGGGILQGSHHRTPNALKGKPVYVGVGAEEGNLVYARNAARIFKELGSVVTLDEYEKTGHSPPPDGQEQHLQQWLQIEAYRTDLLPLKEPAETWFAECFENARQTEIPIEQYLRLTDMQQAPFLWLAGAENRKKLADVIKRLRSGPPIKIEYLAELEYQRVAARELQQRSLANEQQRLGEYLQIPREYPDTYFAERARVDAARVQASIKRRMAYRP